MRFGFDERTDKSQWIYHVMRTSIRKVVYTNFVAPRMYPDGG